jgi:beta-lactamase regulating signal transducer with metallopeptidase domain/N-acetylneuraminic acid mutarotase
MDSVLPSALSFLQSLGRLSWQASVLIAFVFLFQRVFRTRMTAAWCHALWLLVLLRLVLPFSWESRVSVFNWLPVTAPSLTTHSPRAATLVALTAPVLQAVTGNPQSAITPGLRTDTSSKGIFPANGTLVLEEPETDAAAQSKAVVSRERIVRWIAIIWLTGVVLLSTRVIIESLRFSRTVAPKRLVTDSGVLELLEDCKQLMGVSVPVVLVQTDRVSSPVLYGFLRPRLLLPSGLLPNFSRAELRFVLLHELAHIRRHDIAISWLMAAIQILYWFNPLVWFAFARMKADRELACDALVLSCTDEADQKAYGRTMLRLLEGFAPPTRFPAMAGILEDPSQLATRIRCIATFSRRSPSPVWALGVATILALATLTDERIHASPSLATTWPARFVTTRPEGDTDVRLVTLRPQTGVDLQQALNRGGLCLAADTDATNLLNDGYKWIGSVDGLGVDRWQRFSRENTPFPRTAHSVVWTGRELLVWGGGARNFFHATGGRYDPEMDTWKAISTNGAPSGRWQHAAQWTGKEMIVWGGRVNFYPTNHYQNGARYNPATDTWTPMNTKGAPTARSQMSSVWTGREFIVWGGRGDGGPNAYDQPLNDGARYNPETDSWTPMAESPGLGPRYDASAIWTGRELIVWGGGARTGRSLQDQLPYVTHNTGGRYDPATDRWTLLPVENAPRSRYKHTAVWTGTEMLLWGGTTPTGSQSKPTNESFNDGARYNLEADRWTPITINGAPGKRSSHIAVWTGTDMIVWGGGNAKSECLNTGGRYDPKTDRWVPMAVESAPAPRIMMRPDAGIWTGKQLLVFGGYDLNTEFDIGHRWSPPQAVRLFQRSR